MSTIRQQSELDGKPYINAKFSADRRLNAKQPVELTVRQREYRHDVAVMTLDYEDKTEKKYTHGQPVTIQWGFLPKDMQSFHGYIHHTEAISGQQKHKQLRVWCIGASYRMNEPVLRSWKNKTAHDIATTIAKEHRFSISLDRHEYRHEHLTQHGRSDWEFLIWLAKRSGHTFFCTQTNIVFVKRAIKVNHSTPYFVFTPGRGRVRNALYLVKHRIGDSTPGTSKKKRMAFGVDVDGSPFSHLDDCDSSRDPHGLFAPRAPVFSKLSWRRPVRSGLDACNQIAGEADLHRFGHTAYAEVSGNARVNQGSTVRFIGLDKDSDGYWYVGMVDHHVTKFRYTMELEVGREALGDSAKPPVTSVSGKPMVLDDCDVDVDSLVELIPPSVYNDLDDCAPIELAVADDQENNPLGLRPRPRRRSPTPKRPHRCSCGCSNLIAPKSPSRPKKTPKPSPKKKKPTHKPVPRKPTKVAGKSPKRRNAPTPHKAAPKLNGWGAKHHKVNERKR